MKIAYDPQIFRDQRYGGISRYFCELAPRVARAPDTVAHIVAPRHKNEYLDSLKSPLVVGWRMDETRHHLPARIAGRIVEWSAGAWLRPDIVHETYYWGSIVGTRRSRRVLTIYDMIHERFREMFAKDDRTIEAKRLAVARADHLICISESTRRDLIEFLDVPPHKVSMTYLSANIVEARAPAASAALPAGRPYLLYVGVRPGYKNFLALVKAVQSSNVLADFQIVCFGGGPLRPHEQRSLEGLRFDLARLTMVAGADDQLGALYAGAACFVYPSLYEGFGIPPLEAMLCGCPVACSNTSSLPEVVGEAGVYFDPYDAESLREALERIVGSETLATRLRDAGRRRAATFSWDRCADETLAIYRTLL